MASELNWFLSMNTSFWPLMHLKEFRAQMLVLSFRMEWGSQSFQCKNLLLVTSTFGNLRNRIQGWWRDPSVLLFTSNCMSDLPTTDQKKSNSISIWTFSQALLQSHHLSLPAIKSPGILRVKVCISLQLCVTLAQELLCHCPKRFLPTVNNLATKYRDKILKLLPPCC